VLETVETGFKRRIGVKITDGRQVRIFFHVALKLRFGVMLAQVSHVARSL